MVRVNGKLIRKKLYLIIDTETFNGFDEPYCYDIGFAVIDNTGKVYAKYSFVVHETFIGMAEQAATAYYADKFPQYHEDIREGRRKLVSIHTIIAVANALLEKWDIHDVVAHNAKFDCLSTNTTAKLFDVSSFFKRYVEWWDTWQMAKDTICQQKNYIRFCKENGFVTKTGRPKESAEILYRYIKGDKNFNESHTGLEDVMIEKEIFAKCFAQHKKMRHTFVPQYRK